MKKYFILSSVLLLLSCNKPIIEKEYYSSGELKSEITLNREGEREGFTFVYYQNGNLKDKALYKNGKIIDTVYGYNEDGTINNIEYYSTDSAYSILYKNGAIYQKGAFQKYVPNGWIEEYKNGKIFSKATMKNIFGKESPHINSFVVFDEKGDTIKEKSFFYKLSTPDTVFVNQYNLGEIIFYSDKTPVNQLKDNLLIIVVNENITDNYDNLMTVSLDSFAHKSKFLFKFTQTGNRKLRGKFIEQVMLATENKSDNNKLDINIYERDFYFDKEVYVKKED